MSLVADPAVRDVTGAGFSPALPFKNVFLILLPTSTRPLCLKGGGLTLLKGGVGSPGERRETYATCSSADKDTMCSNNTLALRTALCRLHTKDPSGDPSCHRHPLCLPEQPPLTARTRLWDSTGCRGRTQHTSPWKGGASATLLNVCGRLGPSRTEPLCREHRGFFPECQNPWILCTEARIHLGQLSLNLLTAKGQASSMGSKDRPLRDRTPLAPPLLVSTPEESWVWREQPQPAGMVGTPPLLVGHQPLRNKEQCQRFDILCK